MAGKTLQEILGYVPLTGLINRIKTGIPDVIPPKFTSLTKKVPGDAGRYTQRIGVRQTSRRTEYGAPSLQTALRQVEVRDVKCITTAESLVIPLHLFQTLRDYASYEMQELGIVELDHQIADFRQRFDNLTLATIYQMLAYNAIYFDSAGNLQNTSSGAVGGGFSYGVSANNQGQLNGIISASWANLNTDIPLQLRNLKTRAAQLTGYPLKYAFYGTNIPSYLTQNNYVLDYLSRDERRRSKFLDSAELPDLFELEWIPVYTAFFQDVNGTNQTFFGGDTVVFTPEINNDVYEMLQGSTPIPTSLNVYGDMMAAIGSGKMVYGKYAYGVPRIDPLTCQLFSGDVFFPAWKIPDAIFTADVTP